MLPFWEKAEALSSAECARAIALAGGDALRPAEVHGQHGYAPNPHVRDVATSFHPRAPETDWLYARVDGLFAEAAAHLDIAILPMAEDLQILRYGPGNHFQMWHSDAGHDLRGRRALSISIELSDAADYGGGDLELVPHALGRTRPPRRGAARIFPSQALHRVTPVIRGVRWALVNWAGAA
ncbi:2OG-Fe(II) oxygenase [Sphingosinicella sp. BN140058]|uniref:2OG-Fe(II) oxygenase n=1 Tax=Sphingosinicella sp. BN140058 TaxID=1892855 RepID=UPI0013EAFE36|nr:2OG-Fe(II) oxygenase [Sphingosinicella sp. BN140058]